MYNYLIDEGDIEKILEENDSVDDATAAFRELLIERNKQENENRLAYAREDLAVAFVDYIDRMLLANGEEELERDEYKGYVNAFSKALTNFEGSKIIDGIFTEWARILAENAKSEEICPVKKDEEKEDFSTDDFVAWLEENNLL